MAPTGADDLLEYHRKEKCNDQFSSYQSGRQVQIPAELKGWLVWACLSCKCQRLLLIRERSLNSFPSAVNVFQPFFLSAPADMQLLIQAKISSALQLAEHEEAPHQSVCSLSNDKEKKKNPFLGVCIDWANFTTFTFGLD